MKSWQHLISSKICKWILIYLSIALSQDMWFVSLHQNGVKNGIMVIIYPSCGVGLTNTYIHYVGGRKFSFFNSNTYFVHNFFVYWKSRFHACAHCAFWVHVIFRGLLLFHPLISHEPCLCFHKFMPPTGIIRMKTEFLHKSFISILVDILSGCYVDFLRTNLL